MLQPQYIYAEVVVRGSGKSYALAHAGQTCAAISIGEAEMSSHRSRVNLFLEEKVDIKLIQRKKVRLPLRWSNIELELGSATRGTRVS